MTPVLALCAASGMSEGARTEWLMAAADTLTGIPADLLERAGRDIRKTVDHPSKIIPAIYTEIGKEWDRRKSDVARLNGMLTPPKRYAWEPEPLPSISKAERDEVSALFKTTFTSL